MSLMCMPFKEALVGKLLVAAGLFAILTVIAQIAPVQLPTPAEAQVAPNSADATAAAAICTPLTEPDCVANTTCVWLPGYKVANGTEVPGYCRTAPKPLSRRLQTPTAVPPADVR
jgi:hypothetical protein